MPLGVSTIYTGGRNVRASADDVPIYKAAGVTIDWATVAAVTTDRTLADGRICKTGDKYLRYGKVICKIGTAEIQSIAVDATGGTFTISGTVFVNGVSTPFTTAAITFNATPAAAQAALDLAIGRERIVVITGGPGVAGGGTPYTLTFDATQANIAAVTTGIGALTGGASTAAVTTTTAGTPTANVGLGGKFGPYYSGAIDGRQILTRGEAFILNETVFLSDLRSDYPGSVIYGGRVFRDRVLDIYDSVTADEQRANPTKANLETVFPMLAWVED